ncbi:MAG: S9 family peptidase [Lysobacterales bacterium]|jgi:dipeptidyl aminopeptidase/acylaminoacyl peptidase
MSVRYSSFIVALVLTAALLGIAPAVASDADQSSRLAIADLFRLGDVSEPQLSPEGDWIAYTVTRRDLDEDKNRSRVWMVPAAGGEAVPMTAADQSSSHPRWSPDGRYLAFLSGRDDQPAQVWTLNRKGGEAIQVTDTPQDVEDFEWSPDSSRLVLVLQDPTEAEIEAHDQGDAYEEKTPPPWVIDRVQFKSDYVGYLDRRRTHLYLLDLSSDAMTQLTVGDYDDSEPAWSPDGRRLAFTSNRTAEPDLNYNTDIWVVSADPARAPAELTQVTHGEGPDVSPAWSPDGKSIAHTTVTDAEAILYATYDLAVSAADGTATRVLTADLDRMIFKPAFSPDGKYVWFVLEDSGEMNLARVRPKGGRIDRVVTGENVVTAFDAGEHGPLVVLAARPQLPPEVFALEGSKLQQRSFTNREVLSGLTLGAVEKVQFKSADGTPVEGFVIKPPGFQEGTRYPAILDIHGGPQSQYDWSFQFEGQLYAANGYLVIHPNPRGSTGYGQDFCLAIWRDWGGPDYEDVMAAVDDAIARGWADPDRLGVTGWSYGGMLTDHVITKTDRFKAAATGASTSLYVVNYGHDMYQRWWEKELGFPWEQEAREIYERMSPYNHIDRVVTPTLVLGGEIDWNVPVINSEQLYLALKRLGVETRLVVYPGEYHGIDTPSHLQDLYERYINWFGQHLGKP